VVIDVYVDILKESCMNKMVLRDKRIHAEPRNILKKSDFGPRVIKGFRTRRTMASRGFSRWKGNFMAREDRLLLQLALTSKVNGRIRVDDI